VVAESTIPVDAGRVRDAVHDVRQRIAALAGDRSVELIAVTKGFGADALDAALAAGCSMVGENYAQELVAKIAVRPAGRDALEVHFIGQLQTNKVRSIAAIVDVWQTVDRTSLADEIAKRAAGARVFVQVNTTSEAAKGGCPPSSLTALVEHCRGAGLRVEGLMTVGPTSGERGETATAFALLRRLADDNGLVGCSMGMTNDYDLGIEQGATHVRIGSALFGERPKRAASIR
jgi:PLP dependent protein